MKSKRNVRGIAAGLVLPLLAILSLAVGMLSYQIVVSARKTSRFIHKQRAIDLAQAGTEDALFWFRRQEPLPVENFEPTSEDSQMPEYGIVRSLVIDERNHIKGLYIVEKDRTQDLTAKRGEIGSGWIWRISSRGVVYLENDSTLAFDQSPNEIVENVRVTTEIRMLSINPCVDAAIVADKGRKIRVESRGQVYGGNTGSGVSGICFKRKGNPRIYGDVRGDPRYKSFSGLKLDPRDIFGIDQATLRNLADYCSEEGSDDLPKQLPDFSLVYVQGDCIFDLHHPLNGGGILFVDGNLTLSSGSNSSFVGMIYVTGSIDFQTPSWIEGQVVAIGGGNVGKGGYDKSTVLYNKDVLNLVVQLIGNYRKKRTYTIESVL